MESYSDTNKDMDIEGLEIYFSCWILSSASENKWDPNQSEDNLSGEWT